jgi:Protein of unknown function (DUF4238)
MKDEPRDHHYAPQFFLRNFAVDPERRKITTVAKHGQFAVWAKRSIEQLGYERDLYVHLRRGVPISVESTINERVEIPISESDTWAKITSNRTECLDRSDKPILYALIRHLEARTPHYLATARELAHLAASANSGIPFTGEEREAYAFMRAFPNEAKRIFDLMSSTLAWTEQGFRGCGLSILRSPIPLRSSTTPIMSISAPAHPALRLPLPGMVPYQLVLTLNRTTIASLVLADFDDAFMNVEVSVDVAKSFNRHFVGQFAYFEHVRHLITGRDDLAVDMTWAPYDLVDERERKITFRRRSS